MSRVESNFGMPLLRTPILDRDLCSSPSAPPSSEVATFPTPPLYNSFDLGGTEACLSETPTPADWSIRSAANTLLLPPLF